MPRSRLANSDADGNYMLNDNVLIEIGAAFVLYDKRVVLVWDKRPACSEA